MITIEKKLELVKCISEIQFQIEKINIIAKGTRPTEAITDSNFNKLRQELSATNWNLNHTTINL